MPNMSRRSLDHHQERVDNMAKNAPGNESFIRKRYQSNKYKTSDYRRIDYDSQDETDESNNRTVRWWHISEWRLVRWLTTIITTLWTSCTGVFTSRQTTDEHSNYYTQQLHHQQQEQGVYRFVLGVCFGGNFSTLLVYFRLVPQVRVCGDQRISKGLPLPVRDYFDGTLPGHMAASIQHNGQQSE